MTALSWASLSTPVGQVSVACSQAGVARVRYGCPPVPDLGERGASGRGSQNPLAAGFAAMARSELIDYFESGRQAFEVPVDWAMVTGGPQRHVLTVLAETVGYGETISYGALARRAGLQAGPLPAGPVPAGPLPARAVGAIMAANPIPVIVPCHRVLASDGLGGYSGGAGVEVKRWLLILEGSHPPTLDWA